MPDPSSGHVIDLYDRNAPAWESLRGTTLTEQPWLAAFLAAMPPAGKEILDIGCGSGVPIAHHLIGQGYRVTGVDGSAALIARARATFPDHRWIVADMRTLSLDERFHGLIAWHSFFHLPPQDQMPMFDIFRRLSAPGAALMFTSGITHGEAIGSFAGEPLYHAASMPVNTGPCLPATGSPFSGMWRTTLPAAARPSGWSKGKGDGALAIAGRAAL